MCKIILGILIINNIRLILNNYSEIKSFKLNKNDIYDSELKFGMLISPYFMFFIYIYLFFNCNIAYELIKAFFEIIT